MNNMYIVKVMLFLTFNNSGFKQNDSTTNRLLDVTQNYRSLEDGSDVLLVFLNITNSFDKVYVDGLLLKLEQFCITGDLLAFFKSYLHP